MYDNHQNTSVVTTDPPASEPEPDYNDPTIPTLPGDFANPFKSPSNRSLMSRREYAALLVVLVCR